MNVRMSLYCIRVQKDDGRLNAGEDAITLGMIDDAVQAVTPSVHVSVERIADFAASHYKTTFDTWKKMGAKLDTVKTLYSRHSFVYLNRF